MKVLVIGDGGKEHAIVWKLSKSPQIDKIYCCPGNAGIAEVAECVDVSPHNFETLIDFVKYEWIDLTIAGKEDLLSRGIVNAFKREKCRILGPDKDAARFFSSRALIKKFLRLYRISAPEFKVFTSHIQAQDYVLLKGAPLVIKVDNPFVDNGVFVPSTTEEALDTLKLIMKDGKLGDAGKQVIIEEKLKGMKISFLTVTDGKSVILITTLNKFARAGEGDTRYYTTGAGAYSPSTAFSAHMERIVMEKIIKPVVNALNSEGIKYKGFLSADLMLCNGNAYTTELTYSGDIELQTALPRLKTDFMDISMAIIDDNLSDVNIECSNTPSVCLVIYSEGYPFQYRKGALISGLEKIKGMEDTFVFHINTAFKDNHIVNTGGKVISITALGTDIKDAHKKIYDAVGKIHFEGMHYRKDIGIKQ